MPSSAHRLISYYKSPEFATDHDSLAQRNPNAAMQQRQMIISNMNENLATVGILPTKTELAVQARFIAGDLALPQMLDQMDLYISSISLRWLG